MTSTPLTIGAQAGRVAAIISAAFAADPESGDRWSVGVTHDADGYVVAVGQGGAAVSADAWPRKPVEGHYYRHRWTGAVARADRVFRSGPDTVWNYTIVEGDHSVGCTSQAVVSLDWASNNKEVQP